MSESLFRKEALEERAAATAPQPNLATLPSSRAATMVAIGFVSGFILLGVFGEFSRKETVKGVIEPEPGIRYLRIGGKVMNHELLRIFALSIALSAVSLALLMLFKVVNRPEAIWILMASVLTASAVALVENRRAIPASRR